MTEIKQQIVQLDERITTAENRVRAPRKTEAYVKKGLWATYSGERLV